MAIQARKNIRSVSVGAGATTNVCPANDMRLAVVFFNNTAQVVALGKTGVTNNAGATGGIPLSQNQSFTAYDTDDWFCNNPGAGAVDLRIIETVEGVG
jgi:hypothetical protein